MGIKKAFRNWIFGKEAFVDDDALKILKAKKLSPEEKLSKIFEIYVNYFETEDNGKTRENGFLNWVRINVLEGERYKYVVIKDGKEVIDNQAYSKVFHEVAQKMFMENYQNLVYCTSVLSHDEKFDIKKLSDDDQRIYNHLAHTESRYKDKQVDYIDFVTTINVFKQQADAKAADEQQERQ